MDNQKQQSISSDLHGTQKQQQCIQQQRVMSSSMPHSAVHKNSSLMVPRVLKAKKEPPRNVKLLSTKTRNTTAVCTVSRHVTNETQTHASYHSRPRSNKQDSTADTQNKFLDSRVAQCALNCTGISANIYRQQHKPLMHVGAVTHSGYIPVYYRDKQPSRYTKPGHANIYTGLAWEPVERKHTVQDPVFCHPRRWEYTSYGRQHLQKPLKNRDFEFTVMSYNVLAQNLLEDNSHLYEHALYHVLQWNYRSCWLLRELKCLTPDVICLQEVTFYHYTKFFQPELAAIGYDGEFMKRTGDKLDGCATFYKKSKFQLLSSVPVSFCHRHGGKVLDRDNVALILKLKPVTNTNSHTDRSLVVTNTHLLFNPKRGDIKLAQLVMLLAEIDKCSYNSNGHTDDQYQAVIMCGDFNSEPHSEIYKLVIMGQLEYEGLLCRQISGQKEGYFGYGGATLPRDFLPVKVGINENCQYCDVVKDRGCSSAQSDNDIEITTAQNTGLLQHQLKVVSVYQHTVERLAHKYAEVTTHHGQADCIVDYIFYGIQSGKVRFHKGEVQTKDVVEGHLHLLARYGLLASHELAEMGSLPNDRLGSDHLSLMAKFLFE